MRKLIGAVFALLISTPQLLTAQSPATAFPAAPSAPEYLPRVDSLASDWDVRFGTEDSKRDFKRLREYRAEKQSALLEAQAQLATYEGLIEQARSGSGSSANYLARLRELLATVGRDSTVDIGYSMPYEFDQMLGYTTPNSVPASALRDLQQRLLAEDSTAKRRAATIQSAYRLAYDNIRTLEGDIRRVEAAIDAALAPEIRSQQFRTYVSAFFSALIAIMIISFFATIYLRGGSDVASLLLSDGGLQFVTIFVLIIAIILFGILNILEGRELAAILSGIAGYILGRGARIRPDASAPPPPPAGGAPQGAIIPVAGTVAAAPAPAPAGTAAGGTEGGAAPKKDEAEG